MLNLPEGHNTVDDVYNKNEEHTGGHFPIGNNKCWHSGIHVYSNSADTSVRPLIEGQLAAYRINDAHQAVPLLKEITGESHSNLKDDIKKLYKESTGTGTQSFVLFKESLTEREYLALKDTISQNEYDAMPQDMIFFYNNLNLRKELKDLYQKEDSGNYIPVWKFTTNFILLKHHFTIPQPGDGEGKEIEFFSLYMGLKPGVSETHKKYYNTFIDRFDEDENQPLAKPLPFYQSWLFKIKSSQNITYYESRIGKIFVGSHCEFEEMDNDNEYYTCMFDNIKDSGQKISILKRQITIINNPRYVPDTDRISVYHIAPDQQGQLFKIGELKQFKDNGDDVYFEASYKNCEIDGFAETHCEVAVLEGELHPNITTNDYVWWYKRPIDVAIENNNTSIRYSNSVNIYYQKRDIPLYNSHYKLINFYDYIDGINENLIKSKAWFPALRLSDVEIEYDSKQVDIQLIGDKKIVSIKLSISPNNTGPKKIIKVPPKRRTGPFVIIENDRNTDSLILHYQGTKVHSIPFGSIPFNNYGQNNNDRHFSDSLSVVCLSKIPYGRIKQGESLSIKPDVFNGANSLPDYVQTGEGLHYCRLMCTPYLEGSKTYPVIVKKLDLKISKARGYLKDIPETIAGLTRNVKKGVILYDGSSKDTNAYNMLAEGDEFIPRGVSGYKSKSDDNLLPVHREEGLKYASFKDTELSAKIVYQEEYGGNNNTIKKSDKIIRFGDVLGYADEHFKQNYLYFYDMVCFFNDKSFLDDTTINENEESNLLNWKEHFIVEETDNDRDLFCDSANEIKEAIKQQDAEARQAMTSQNIFNGVIGSAEFIKLYEEYKNHHNAFAPVISGIRKLVISHPLEWDKMLYNEKAFPLYAMSRERREQLQKEMELRDIWKEGGVEGINEAVGNPGTNNFWFAHPVYFLYRLDDEELLPHNTHVKNLIEIQNMVVDLECLTIGAGGIYQLGKGETFCNHAAFLTIIATDGRYDNFTGRVKREENNYEYPFPDPTNHKAYEEEHGIKSSNFWCDKLEELARGDLLVRLSPQDAQKFGNMGYTVIASYRANPLHGDKSPHFATVRPGFPFDDANGPIVANVGANNLKEGKAKDIECFGLERYNETKWYYNPEQDFRVDTRWIQELGE